MNIKQKNDALVNEKTPFGKAQGGKPITTDDNFFLKFSFNKPYCHKGMYGVVLY